MHQHILTDDKHWNKYLVQKKTWVANFLEEKSNSVNVVLLETLENSINIVL